jgi:hypothetical protein
MDESAMRQKVAEARVARVGTLDERASALLPGALIPGRPPAGRVP